jgi:hypothetical protein
MNLFNLSVGGFGLYLIQVGATSPHYPTLASAIIYVGGVLFITSLYQLIKSMES